jgi:hypothetical protein
MRKTKAVFKVFDQIFLIAPALCDMHHSGVTRLKVVRHHDMVDVLAQAIFKVQLTVLVDLFGAFYHKPIRLLPSDRLIFKGGDLGFPSSSPVGFPPILDRLFMVLSLFPFFGRLFCGHS